MRRGHDDSASRDKQLLHAGLLVSIYSIDPTAII
jgi:hypothetical protein